VKRLGAALLFVAVVAGALMLTAGEEPTRTDPIAPEATASSLTATRMDGNGEFDLAQLASAETPTLLFDESMSVWTAYKIPAQPGAVLLDRSGRERARWRGAFDTNPALEAAREL
jgi:hypothetical protein